MKTKNSPVNKNSKRIRAAKMIERWLKSGEVNKRKLQDKDIERLKKEHESLASKIIPEEAAIMRRTKKYRGAKL